MSAPDVRLTLPTDDLPAQIYRLIADTIPHMVWTARPDGSNDYFNQRLLEYAGLRAEQMHDLGWQLIVHQADLPDCLARWTRSLESGEPFHAQYRLRRADGDYRWHIGAAQPLRDASGRITKWFGTCTDIEEQKRAPGASQSRLRQIIDNEPECVKLLDANGRLLGIRATSPSRRAPSRRCARARLASAA